MRICLLLAQGNMFAGGQGVYTYYLTQELVRLGHEVHLIVGPPYPDMPPGVQLHFVESYSSWRMWELRRFVLPENLAALLHPVNLAELATSSRGMFSDLGAFSLRAFSLFCDLRHKIKFDVVHDNQSLGYGSLLIRATGVPVVATLHHPLTLDRKHAMQGTKSTREKIKWIVFYPFFMQGLVARRTDRLIVVSRAVGQDAIREFAVRPEKLRVIHNGVDTQRFEPQALARRPNSLIFVGNSDNWTKGTRYLFAALARLRHLHFRLTMVGRVEAQLEWTVRLVDQLSLRDNIDFVGHVSTEQLADLYATSELAVCPSLYEGFGLPALEAMACGTPVVGTRTGGLPEVIEHGVTGLLVPPADVAALADAIARLMTDDRRRGEMGKAARDSAVERFSWASTAARTLDVYQEVAEEFRTRV